MQEPSLPGFDDVRVAADRIRGIVKRTPAITCSTLNRMCGAELFFKCENLQKTGAFKYRGATNAVRSLSDEAEARGVATHSSGNHAAALALAARTRGVAAFIVMPRTAPRVKQAAVAGYGGNIVLCDPTLEARETTLARVVRETGATVVHPYDDSSVIAGQGTAALELIEEVPGLDVVMTPVGGGGLTSGTALAVKGSSPGTRIVAAEPEGASDAAQTLREGRIVPSVDPKSRFEKRLGEVIAEETSATAGTTASGAPRDVNIMLFDSAEAVKKPIGAASAEAERAAIPLK